MHLLSRSGFTLVELLVAVLLIDVGVLAMVSGTAILTRRQNEMRVRATAAQLAANGIQRMTGGGCVSTAGVVTQQSIVEHYAATMRSDRLRELYDSVTFTIAGAPKSIVIRSRVPC